MVYQMPHYAFPERYDDNYLMLLVRDPRCIFAYWEFSDEQMNLVMGEFEQSWGEVPLLLRVYDLTGLNFDGSNAHSYFDLPVHPLANNYYIKEISPNHSYCVDIGVVLADGRFLTLSRSNVVQTPRDSTADGAGTSWADLLERLTEKHDAEAVTGPFSSEGVYLASGDKDAGQE